MKMVEVYEDCNCAGCWENNRETYLNEDWLQYDTVQLFMHENCIEFDYMCSKWGVIIKIWIYLLLFWLDVEKTMANYARLTLYIQ